LGPNYRSKLTNQKLCLWLSKFHWWPAKFDSNNWHNCKSPFKMVKNCSATFHLQEYLFKNLSQLAQICKKISGFQSVMTLSSFMRIVEWKKRLRIHSINSFDNSKFPSAEAFELFLRDFSRLKYLYSTFVESGKNG
jgi:hypothetical protein